MVKYSPTDIVILETKAGTPKTFQPQTLLTLLPDVETALFFCKAIDLKLESVRKVLYIVEPNVQKLTDLIKNHEFSTELQEYGEVLEEYTHIPTGTVVFNADTTPLPDSQFSWIWEFHALEVASNIKEVAEILVDQVAKLQGKQGTMEFQQLRKFNVQRNSLGKYSTLIKHAHAAPNLVVLDVSGSMSEGVIRAMVEDVVALAWQADASLAIVSGSTYSWDAGTFTVKDVLDHAEYGGTVYESLAPLFETKHWGQVITIADYDSARSAKQRLAKCKGHIDKVIDISLVPTGTFLAECLAQLADDVELISLADYSVLRPAYAY